MEREQVTCFPGSTLYDLAFFLQRLVRLAYQPPTNSTFLSKQISHQQPIKSTAQQYFSFSTNQHQPPSCVRAAPLSVSMYMTLWE
jgi:hypothetical protein